MKAEVYSFTFTLYPSLRQAATHLQPSPAPPQDRTLY